MKKFKKIICSVLMVVLVVLSLNGTSVMGYYSIGKGDTISIDPSNNQFKKAKSKVYDIYSVYIPGNIKEKYGLEIFHYKAQESGFYIVYTTGSLDTVGKVYEEQNVLWTADYDVVASNDNGYYLNNGTNCAMVVEMDKGEDYYICIRAKGTKTGIYGLNIAPNEDKINSNKGGIWVLDEAGTTDFNKGYYLCEKQYLTKEQVIFLYWTLDQASQKSVKEAGYSVEILKEKYRENLLDAVKYGNTITSLMVGNTATSLNQEILTLILEKKYFESSDEKMKTKLVNMCGVNHDVVSGKWTAKNGMVAERWWTLNPFVAYDYKYYGSNSTTLTGRTYYYGKWK